MIPKFNDYGLLPQGDYEVTFEELRSSPLVVGPEGRTSWDRVWRAQLVDNLEILTDQLWRVGIRDVYAGGSFVSLKDQPGDIDGYFVCDRWDYLNGALYRRLNLIDPYNAWTVEQRPNRRGLFGRLVSFILRRPSPIPRWHGKSPMWWRFRVELFPYYGQYISGIRSLRGNNMSFASAFRNVVWRDGTGMPRGILKLVPP